MNKTIGLQLIVYSLLLAGLSYFTHHVAPAQTRPVLIAGLAGGALCLVWGLRAVRGSRGKALSMLTLIPVNFVVLSQTVIAWWGGTQESPDRRTAAVMVTLLFLLSFGMLIRIAYAGMVIDGLPAAPTADGGVESPTPGKPVTQASPVKRA